ncbi:MAG: ankyrin repeat domain-containing protein [Sphingobacteriia bacterium]|nr:ankyrin repeat domain-containing protein [Sphingobacteriia bacterium]
MQNKELNLKELFLKKELTSEEANFIRAKFEKMGSDKTAEIVIDWFYKGIIKIIQDAQGTRIATYSPAHMIVLHSIDKENLLNVSTPFEETIRPLVNILDDLNEKLGESIIDYVNSPSHGKFLNIATLLACGASPNTNFTTTKTDANGKITQKITQPAVIYAMNENCFNLTKLLLQFHANPNERDNSHRTALHILAKKPNYEFTELFLAYGSDLELRLYKHLPRSSNRVREMLRLIGEPQDFHENNLSPIGDSSIDLALYHNNIGMIKLILKQLNKLPDTKYTLQGFLLLAVKCNRYDIFSHLLSTELKLEFSNDPQTELYMAVQKGDLEKVRELISKCDINDQIINGNTALHLACFKGYAGIVSLLLENGANPNIKNDLGFAPIHLAVTSNIQTITMLKTLLENGADINIQDAMGLTPLHYAASKGHVNIAEFLIDNDADYNIKTNVGNLPYDLINNEKMRDFFKKLEVNIVSNADINIGNIEAFDSKVENVFVTLNLKVFSYKVLKLKLITNFNHLKNNEKATLAHTLNYSVPIDEEARIEGENNQVKLLFKFNLFKNENGLLEVKYCGDEIHTFAVPELVEETNEVEQGFRKDLDETSKKTSELSLNN